MMSVTDVKAGTRLTLARTKIVDIYDALAFNINHLARSFDLNAYVLWGCQRKGRSVVTVIRPGCRICANMQPAFFWPDLNNYESVTIGTHVSVC